MSTTFEPTVDPAGYDRQPPQDVASEQSALGGMLLSKDAVADVVETLSGTADFYRPAHQAIYACILDLYGRGEPADPITVSAELERRGELGRVGGAPYLHTLIATVPTAANAGYYAEIVAEKAVLRRMVEAGTRIAQFGYGVAASDSPDIGAVVARAHETLEAVTSAREASRETSSFGDLIDATLAAVGDFQQGAHQTGIKTGLMDFDELTNGLHPGQLIVVAARPGVGKSVLGLQFARSAALDYGLAAGIFSLEMSKTEIMIRAASAESKVRLSAMRQEGGLTDFDWHRLRTKMDELRDAPLYIDDSPNLTIPEIKAKARRLKQRHDLKLLVIDYLQLMTSSGRVENRQQEVAEFSRQLKLLAKELEIPIVAISQLNRGPDQRADKRPQLSDLRESGSIEQDADLVILLNRPDAYTRDDPRAGEIDLILAKHRDGPQATIVCSHQLHCSSIMSHQGE